MDLNGPYYPTFACNFRNNIYGRSPLTNEELVRLNALTGANLATDGWNNDQKWNFAKVVFERPELSPCLADMDKNSAAYKEALGIIRNGAKVLNERTRADMVNFQMKDEDDLRRLQKYNQCRLNLLGQK